ncbi:anti-sigma factor [Luteolibacter sp. GHJ8]|uniref:Anti-sigma factor n=1 Tax=Luteolibacter rhizosphaerae TaxID=2989719 RepID=A0ABT3G084_9BACT|nr:anti-sigma factor [Luteolibacter rhizosphaerae]MCW1913253.1 anti-sigma factor [Luteolibacter rhizosphaerae]
MTREEKEARFEELDSGRALGDLDAAETAEWEALSASLGCGADPLFDRLVGELSANSPVLDLSEVVATGLKVESKTRPRNRFGTWMGWALAACLLGLLILRQNENPPKRPTAAENREALLREGKLVLRLDFNGTEGAFADVQGEVVWSDSRQEGYLTLSHLPSNNPLESQYQLWIVDPSRDELPVDGGVFDIRSSSGPTIISIDAKLPVHAPAAFVVTREKPGGVVRSKQEVVAAIAKR